MNITLTVAFESALATAMEDFIRTKKLEGYNYDGVASILKVFDRFLSQSGFVGQRLDRETVNNYIAESRKAELHPNSLYRRIWIASKFSRYLTRFDPDSYALEKIPVSKTSSRRPYLYSQEEILGLIEAAGKLRSTPSDPLRPHTYRTLIGLLYVSGLRIGEALGLSEDDFDRRQNRLYVRKGKFGKDRWVPLEESVSVIIDDYTYRRRKVVCASQDHAALFIGRGGERLKHSAVGSTFRKLLDICQIKGTAQSRPRVHDLRHTFAVQRVRQAYEQGKDVNALLPVLATYMGHRTITGTQVYLHATEELRQEANKRFRQYAQEIIPQN